MPVNEPEMHRPINEDTQFGGEYNHFIHGYLNIS